MSRRRSFRFEGMNLPRLTLGKADGPVQTGSPIHGQPYAIFGALWIAFAPATVLAAQDPANADDSEPARLYSTPAERREAGVRHQLTPNLALSFLAEFEYLADRYRLQNSSSRVREHNFGATMQLALIAAPTPWLGLEAVYQYETDRRSERHSLEEAIVSVKVDNVEGEFGKMFLPFGVYFSRFVSAPLLEFGETRAQAATISYGPRGDLNATAFLYRSKPGTNKTNGAQWGYGLAFEVAPYDFLRMGASYLSNLGDSNLGLQGCGSASECHRVSGVSAYAVATSALVEVTAEILGAVRSQHGSAGGNSRPRAWNIEFALYPQDELSVAFRLEGSVDLTDAPAQRAGFAVAWRVAKGASIALEYLRSCGTFDTPAGNAVDRGERVGAQLVLSF